jgi:hypothetical protein
MCLGIMTIVVGVALLNLGAARDWTSAVSLPAVEKFATEARTDAYRAIQNIDVSAPLPPDVVHMVPLRRRTEVLWGRVFMIAGASAIAIGAAVWWIRRRTGA